MTKKMENEGKFLREANQMKADKRKEYNKNLTKLDPRYSSLTPLGSYIIRMQIRDEVKTKSGLYIPDVKIKTTSHSGMADWEARDPFQFTQTAVIVAVPEGEPQLAPGDLVQVVKPQMLTDKEEVLSYDTAYMHPDYLIHLPPIDPSDEDFGYAIVPRGHIKVLISKANKV